MDDTEWFASQFTDFDHVLLQLVNTDIVNTV